MDAFLPVILEPVDLVFLLPFTALVAWLLWAFVRDYRTHC